MEYCKRCSRCGRRTPSYDNENYLNEYINEMGWGYLDDDSKLFCPDCFEKMKDPKFRKQDKVTRFWDNVITISCVILLIILIKLCF